METLSRNPQTVPNAIDDKREEVARLQFQHLPLAQKRGISFYMVASALANVGDGGIRSLTVNSIRQQVYRKHLGKDERITMTDALEALGCNVQIWKGSRSRVLLPTDAKSAVYIEAMEDETLPLEIDEWRFQIGARGFTKGVQLL